MEIYASWVRELLVALSTLFQTASVLREVDEDIKRCDDAIAAIEEDEFRKKQEERSQKRMQSLGLPEQGPRKRARK